MALDSTTPTQAADSIQAANQVQQNAAPNPAAAVFGSVPLPVANAQQPSANQQPTPTTAQPNQPTVSPDDAHSHLVGSVFKSVANALGGRRTVYTPDPNTGTVQAQDVPRRPGGFFRDLIAGALAGEAAASEPTAHPSGAAGLARGFMGAP